ncbi:MAG: hypothetical protein IPH75_06475 [bacterium]|nr:hypothetical protein [bacterium]
MRHLRTIFAIALLISATLAGSSVAQTDTTGDTLTALEVLNLQADTLATFVTSPIAKQFLAAVPDLPSIESRVVYVNKTTRSYMSEAEYKKATDTSNVIARSEATKQSIEGYERRDVGEEFYYFTRYGTPLAFARALDLVGMAGLAKLIPPVLPTTASVRSVISA